jgi:hypothetical protein
MSAGWSVRITREQRIPSLSLPFLVSVIAMPMAIDIIWTVMTRRCLGVKFCNDEFFRQILKRGKVRTV